MIWYKTIFKYYKILFSWLNRAIENAFVLKIYWRISDTIQNLVKLTSCLPTCLLFACIQCLFKWSHFTVIFSKTITLCSITNNNYGKIFKQKRFPTWPNFLHYAKTKDFQHKNSIMSTRYQIKCKNHCINIQYYERWKM